MKKIVEKYRFGIVMLCVVLFLSSCVEDDTCGENTITGIIVSVKNSGSDDATDTDALNQNAVSDWKICPAGDTTVFVAKSTDYQFGIPLDLEDTTIQLVFYIKDNGGVYLNDTLRFVYHQTDMKLVSVACGFAPEFEITEGQHGVSVLDSVVLEELVVSNDLSINNVTLYY